MPGDSKNSGSDGDLNGCPARVAEEALQAVATGSFWIVIPEKVRPAVTRWCAGAVAGDNPDLQA